MRTRLLLILAVVGVVFGIGGSGLLEGSKGMASQGPVQIKSALGSAEAWSDRPDLVPKQRIAQRYSLTRSGRALVFSTSGSLARMRSMRWSRDLAGLGLKGAGYFRVEYRLEGAGRESTNQSVLSLSGSDAGGGKKSAPLLFLSDCISDGNLHRAVGRFETTFKPEQLVVSLDSRDSECRLDLLSVDFAPSWTDLQRPLSSEPLSSSAAGRELQTVDLDGSYNSSYDDLCRRLLERPGAPPVTDAGSYFGRNRALVHGIPFQLKSAGNNLVSPPPETGINDEIIENFGLKVRRGLAAPISRDDPIEIRINASVSELFFLMAAEFPGRRQYYATPDAPFAIEDVEAFAVELLYADGTRDLAFPYSIDDRRHIIRRAFGCYALPAAGKRLGSVVFRNRSAGRNLHIAALTVNKGKQRLYPRLASEPDFSAQPGGRAEPPPLSPYVRGDESLLRIGNRFMELAVAPSPRFRIVDITNRWLPRGSIAVRGREAGLEISRAGRNLNPEKIRLTGVERRTSEGMAQLWLNYLVEEEGLPLELRLSLSAAEKSEISMRLQVVSRASTTEKIRIIFPCMRGLRIGDPADLWYMYPQYRNALSNAPAAFDQQFSFAFPMQFYDAYNPRLGGGVYVMTRERNHVMRRYGFAKKETGADCWIDYPEDYTRLEPGKPFVCSETVIGAHAGDWHEAAARYKEWVDGWYRPVRCQDKQWFREAFWLLAEIADGLADEMYRLPAWYDAGWRKYRIRDILEEHRRLMGTYPDILHFWSWAYSERSIQRWGGYDEVDYEKIGGRENFRRALDEVQKDLKIPVSLYINANLCSDDTPIFQRLGPAKAMLMENGQHRRWDQHTYTMCHVGKEWTEYLVEVYRRLFRELGVPILYVDQVASVSQLCFSTEHGHEAPLNMNRADHEFIKAIREGVPDEVVLYGEFPLVDVTAPYFDCAINYYFLSLGDQRFALTYDSPVFDNNVSPAALNVYRFVFPKVVQLDLPLGMRHGSWHPLKFIFFNGESIYDSYWDRDESKAVEFTLKAYEIKKSYQDCFTSDNPEMLVPTVNPGICANRFPGRGRTVWTLYNQTHRSVRGDILRISHKPGAKYFDVWAKKPVEVRLDGGDAVIPLELEAQAIGCVAQVETGAAAAGRD